jgi:hypothetical protein
MSEQFHIEVTSFDGASKWIHNITSHSRDQLKAAYREGGQITIVEEDGSEALLDLDETYMIRIQDEKVYRDRVGKKNGRRHPQSSRRGN